MDLKNEGNSKYREHKFEEAMEAYTSKKSLLDFFND
jgi:hypothetical protein